MKRLKLLAILSAMAIGACSDSGSNNTAAPAQSGGGELAGATDSEFAEAIEYLNTLGTDAFRFDNEMDRININRGNRGNMEVVNAGKVSGVACSPCSAGYAFDVAQCCVTEGKCGEKTRTATGNIEGSYFWSQKNNKTSKWDFQRGDIASSDKSGKCCSETKNIKRANSATVEVLNAVAGVSGEFDNFMKTRGNGPIVAIKRGANECTGLPQYILYTQKCVEKKNKCNPCQTDVACQDTEFMVIEQVTAGPCPTYDSHFGKAEKNPCLDRAL